MSHTTEIESVVIQDIAALEATVAELNRAGIKCSLSKGGTPRAFYKDQQGMGPADYVLKLDACPYDVGLYSNGKGGYNARTDLWGGHVARVLGAQPQGKESAQQAALGKLYQGYAVNAAVRQATKQGYRVQRNLRPDGTVQLTMTV